MFTDGKIEVSEKLHRIFRIGIEKATLNQRIAELETQGADITRLTVCLEQAKELLTERHELTEEILNFLPTSEELPYREIVLS